MQLIPKSLKTGLKNWVAKSLSEGEINILAATRGSGGDVSGKINNKMLPISRKEIDDWIKALNALRTERPTRLLMTAIVDRVMLDDQVTRGVNKRMARIKSSRFKTVDDKKQENEDARDFFEKKWFTKFLGWAVLSQVIGTKLIEVSELNEERHISKLTMINDNNVDPWKKIIVKNAGDEKGWDYSKPPLSPYYIEVGDMDELPVIMKIAPLVIYKSLAMQCWADYAHKYGVPPRVLKRKGADKKRLTELEDIMKNMLGSNWAIINEQETLEIFEPKNATGSKDVFDGLIERLNSAIMGLLIGQDGTTEGSKSGTFGSLKAMAEVSEEIHNEDKLMLYYLINDELIPRMIEYGYPLTNLFFEWDEFQELSAQETIDAVSKLSTHYEFDIEELKNKTGLPITALRRLPGENSTGNGEGLGKLNARMQALYPSRVHAGINVVANVPNSTVQNVIRSIFEGRVNANQLDAALATSLGDTLYNGASQAFDTSNVAWNHPDNLLASKLRDNLYAFSSAKSYAEMRQMGALLVDEQNQVRSFADFKREAEKIAKIFNETWLETEYNNAVASGQMAAQWNRYQADKDLLPFLVFVTAGDNRVRDPHALLDGFKAHIDDPVWDRYYPPLDHGCRCDADATGDSSGVGTREANIDVPPAFQANVGKSGIVYTNAHPYYQTMPQAPTSLDAVKNYGMKKASAMLADANKLPYVAPINIDEYWKGNDAKVLTDFSKLKIKADKHVFNGSDRANRLEQLVGKPSEVWTNERSTRYLKYYEDGAALVDVNSDMTATGFRWFAVEDAELIDTVRKGILLKR